MQHLLFIGSSGLSFSACQRNSFNLTSSIIGTPLWVVCLNALILPGAMKVNFNQTQSLKIASLQILSGTAVRETLHGLASMYTISGTQSGANVMEIKVVNRICVCN